MEYLILLFWIQSFSLETTSPVFSPALFSSSCLRYSPFLTSNPISTEYFIITEWWLFVHKLSEPNIILRSMILRNNLKNNLAMLLLAKNMQARLSETKR